MAIENRETVVVDGGRRSSTGLVVGLIVLAIAVLLFFYFGGMNLFNGSNGDANSVNVTTPDTVKVQPAN